MDLAGLGGLEVEVLKIYRVSGFRDSGLGFIELIGIRVQVSGLGFRVRSLG